MTHQPELVDRFPPQANQYGASHWPILRFVVAHELASGAVPRPVRSRWDRKSSPELPAEAEVVGRLVEVIRRNEQFDRLLDAAAQCRLPQRNRPRSYPREVIPRRRTFPRRQRSSEQKN